MSAVKGFHKSAVCPICRCTVIVRKRVTVKASLMRALSLADHVRTLHPLVTP